MFSCDFSKDFVGKVFKVTHDKQKGALSLIRILSGKLRKGSKVVSSRGISENVPKLYEALADEYREIQEIGEGDIAICGGLKVNWISLNRNACLERCKIDFF